MPCLANNFLKPILVQPHGEKPSQTCTPAGKWAEQDTCFHSPGSFFFLLLSRVQYQLHWASHTEPRIFPADQSPSFAPGKAVQPSESSLHPQPEDATKPCEATITGSRVRRAQVPRHQQRHTRHQLWPPPPPQTRGGQRVQHLGTPS
jgi:hypothetical protein